MATTKKVVKTKDSVLEQKVDATIQRPERKEITISKNDMVNKLLHGHNDYQDYLKGKNDKAVAESDKKWYKFATKDQATRFVESLGETAYKELNNAYKLIRQREFELNQFVWDEYRNGKHSNLDKTEDREYIKKMESELAELKSMLNQFLNPTITAAKAAREKIEKESE
jgi:hypothetical protein